MVNFPFYRYPYYTYFRTPLKCPPIPSLQEIEGNKQSSSFSSDEVKEESKYEQKKSRYSFSGPINIQNIFSSNFDEPIFEMLGIKLYLDDLIIIGLLFFLYNEGVKDELLFLSLIFLLLS